MSECKVNKDEEKDDLQYVNVDETEPMDQEDFDEISASFVRLNDLEDDETEG